MRPALIVVPRPGRHGSPGVVKAFYSEHYTQANLMLGVAGGYPEDYLAVLTSTLEALPAGEVSDLMELPTPTAIAGRRFTLVDKETDSVGIHAVMVTNNAGDVQAYLEADESSPMQYNTAPEPEVVEDDKVIDAIEVALDAINIVPIGEMFQR